MIRNQKGMALIVALIFSLISLMLVSMVLYISTLNTKLSGKLKIYSSAVNAAIGAYELTTNILPSIKQKNSFDLSGIDSLVSYKEECLNVKLNNLTRNWVNSTQWSGNNCPTFDKAVSSNLNDIINFFDLEYKIGSYTVYIKITSTGLGNTKLPDNTQLNSGSVTSSKAGVDIVKPPKMPYIYRVDMVSEDKSGYNVQITTFFAY